MSFYVFAWIVMAAALVLTVWSLAAYFVECSHVLGIPLGKARAAARQQSAPAQATHGSPFDAPTLALATRIIQRASAQARHIGTAESCTGGLVSAALTAVPGSSAVVQGAIVSYDESVKQARLGVEAATLASVGAVSHETAHEMAAGAVAALDVDIAVSITGVAGPGGGSAEKPVGTVWFGRALRGASGLKQVEGVEHFAGDRDAVRAQAVYHALELIDEALGD
jgi:PncC family amidohydrolase